MRRALPLYAVLAAALALPASAAAQDLVAHFTPFDLADGRVALPGAEDWPEATGLAVTVTVDGTPQEAPCTLDLSGAALVEAGPDSCRALWALAPLRPVTLTFALGGGGGEGPPDDEASDEDPEGGDPDGGDMDGGGGGADTPVTVALTPVAPAQTRDLPWDGTPSLTVPGATDLAVLDFAGGKPFHWRRYPAAGPVALKLSQVAGLKAPNQAVWAQTDAGLLRLAVVSRPAVATPTPTPTPRPPTGSGRGEAGGAAPLVEELPCPPRGAQYEDHIIVCVDAHKDTLEYRVYPRGRQVVKPNRQFLVRVYHLPNRRVTLELGGEPGTTAPGARPQSQGEEIQLRATGDEGPVAVLVTDRVFVPRRPGPANLTLTLIDKDSGAPLDEASIEFFVQLTYSGAFRIGVGAVFAGAVDAQYTARTVAGSSQAEIVGEAESDINIDIILGYSAYLDSDGRPENGCELKPWCFSPYFGLGLLSPRTNGEVDFLKSLHVGVEWEPVPSLAIGVTGVLRRVTRLAPGVRLGQAIEAGAEVPTVFDWDIGVGVVINLSPDFLKNARAIKSDLYGE